ncbi:DUF2786 domain-containing protein [Alloalcanivorax xenomutans]|uniref:DUF2786 domain-containing protein n=1 Tax=Alloalcanivorax xenomutans TaxID=1094342 RepID=UPI003008BF48
MDKEKVLRRIQKCLALAKSSNPNEAETALRQARRLMEQYNIEEGAVAALDASEVLQATGCKGQPPHWKWHLAYVVGEAFSCKVVLRHGLFDSHFAYIGTSLSPKLAQYAFEVLERQLVKARREHVAGLKRCKLATKRRRGDVFANAWVDAVAMKVQAFAGMNEETQQAIDAFIKEHHPDLKTAESKPRKAKANDDRSAWDGHRSGRSATLNHGVAGQDGPARLHQAGE